MNNRIWVFGDSFSAYFRYINYYVEYIGYEPKNFGDLIGDHFNIPTINRAHGGSDNHSILDRIIDHLDEIQKNDIIIIGWTDQYRTRVVNNDDEWELLNPGHINQPTVNLSKYSVKTIKEIIFNRDSKKYTNEVNNFIKLLNYTFKNNIILHWSWIDHENELITNVPKLKNAKTIFQETNGDVKDFHWGMETHKDLSQIIINLIIDSGKYI
jgi:hypothetical protein